MKDYSFGNFLHELRERRGLSQYQLGMLVGVSNKAVSKWENGSSKPQTPTLSKLSEILGVTVDELLACKYRSSDNKEGIFAMKKELWNKARLRLTEKYGTTPPVEVVNRFESEKAELRDSDLIVFFDMISHVIEKSKEAGHIIQYRGGLGGYFVSYLLGANDINPLDPHYHCPDCHLTEFIPDIRDGWDLPRKNCSCGKEMRRDGHSISYESYRRTVQKSMSFLLASGASFYGKAKEILSTAFVEYHMTAQEFEDNRRPDATFFKITEDHEKTVCSVTLIISDELDGYSALEKETNTSFDRIPYFSPEVLESFVKGNTDKIPEFSPDTMKAFLKEVKPDSFYELIKTDGFAHGSGTWFGNAQDLMQNGKSTKELIAYYDDVFDFVQDKLIERGSYGTGFAYKVMENTRRGIYSKEGIDEETKKIFSDIGIPNYFAESIQKIRYLFPKTLGVSRVKQAMIMMWYKLNYPEQFEKLIR